MPNHKALRLEQRIKTTRLQNQHKIAG